MQTRDKIFPRLYRDPNWVDPSVVVEEPEPELLALPEPEPEPVTAEIIEAPENPVYEYETYTPLPAGLSSEEEELAKKIMNHKRQYKGELANKTLVCLSAKQRKAVEYLAKGYTINETAMVVGVSEYCLKSWKKTALFREELEKTLDLVLEESRNKIKTSIPAIIDKLVDIALTGDKQACLELLDRAGITKLASAGSTEINNSQQNIVIKVDLNAHRVSEKS